MALPSTAIATRGVLTSAIVAALEALELSDKELAVKLRISPAFLSRQKNGREGYSLQVQRIDALPAADLERVLDALLDELARARGVTVVRPDGALAHIATAVRAMSAAVEQFAAARTGKA